MNLKLELLIMEPRSLLPGGVKIQDFALITEKKKKGLDVSTEGNKINPVHL